MPGFGSSTAAVVCVSLIGDAVVDGVDASGERLAVQW